MVKRRGKGKEREALTQEIKISNLSQGAHNNYKGKERKAPMRKLNFSHCSCITKFRDELQLMTLNNTYVCLFVYVTAVVVILI